MRLADHSNLRLGSDGIFRPLVENPSHIRFPQDGHKECLDIEAGSFWFQHRNDCLWEVLQRFSPGGPLLDVGGGNGFVSASLIGRGQESILLEPGLDGARAAKGRGVGTVICSTLEDAGFVDGTIDSVGLFDVLEHIDDDHAFLNQVSKCLRPGGRIYVTVPAYTMLWSDIDEVAGHCRRYTLRKLEADLSACGFKPLFGTYFFSFLPVPILVRRVLLARLRKPGIKPYQAEHGWGGGFQRTVIKALCGSERFWISRGRSIPFGSSCLVVAEATANL